MKCHLCGRHKTSGAKGKPIILMLSLLIVVAMVIAFLYNIRTINSLKGEINALTGLVVKEPRYNETEEDCRYESVKTLEYFEDTEMKVECSEREFEYRIDDGMAVNTEFDGVDVSYVLVNLENHKIELCDTFFILNDKEKIAVQEMGCTKFAPGEKIEKKAFIPYFNFPDNSNHFYGDKINVKVEVKSPEECISREVKTRKPSVVQKKFYVCSE